MDMERMMHRALFFVVVLLAFSFAKPVEAQYQAEVTFDDWPAHGLNKPECNNMESPSEVTVTLQGTAWRSKMDEGYYGQAAELFGGVDSVLFENYSFRGAFIAHFWLKVDATEVGVLIADPGRWELRLDGGEVAMHVTDTSGATALLTPTHTWADDGAYHHVTLSATGLDATPQFTLTVDFDTVVTMAAATPLGSSSGTVVMGEGMHGLIDEVILANNSVATLSAEQDRFNRDPDYCPEGLTCLETVYNLLPRAYTREIPVRFKTVFDPLLCSAATPCPLLFALQGGGACSNDYAMPSDLIPMASYGFIIVTIDPYCEASGETFVPETEVSQFDSVKEVVLSFHPYTSHIASGEFAATGCSHGAEAVLLWAMTEDDPPVRTFIRSAGVAGFCPAVAGKICGVQGGTDSLPVDIESTAAQEYHAATDAVGMISHAITREIEMARSWGVNLEGPLCPEAGELGCKEEGLWGMTYASRRFKTVWQAYESAESPTGYFVEDVGADCRHCAPPGSVAFECGMCLLMHGRTAMELECPDCLLYSDDSIQEGGEAEACPLEASWYEDPLENLPDPDAGTQDAGSDAEPDGDTITPGGSTGCTCTTHGTAPLPFSALLLMALLALSIRKIRF